MNRFLFIIITLSVIFTACSTTGPIDNGGTIAQLRNRHIEIKDVPIEGGFEKAMESYQRFLEESDDSTFAPEAIRRLADLKIEKEYGHLSEGEESNESEAADRPLPAPVAQPVDASAEQSLAQAQVGPEDKEGDADFENRASSSEQVSSTAPQNEPLPGTDDLERAGALEAVALYQKLLDKYPLYERNDQVLYQMSRAYEELGRIEEAMEVMDRLVRDYPDSRYLDEVQFRRAEYFFTHSKYLDAEDAYKGIVDIGVGSFYYQLALYKLGWTFYKQELYSEALDNFMALLDYKVDQGYDFNQTESEMEKQRMEDTFRVISLGFSNIGGANAVVDYFNHYGKRVYEYLVYSNLAEYYYDKRRYSDATATYDAFISRNAFHAKSPNFHMRVVEINIAGGFPTLVIDSKKSFATNYGLKAEYWQHFVPADRPDVLSFLKTNLNDLATHYHALYQNKKRVEDKPANLAEALHWYREYISSFPMDEETPAINYQLASLFLENNSFADAAVEFEKTSYDYPRHEKSSEAGYAAVYAFRQQLDAAPTAEKEKIKREAVRSSLKFADTYPEHEKAAIVLGAATDDLDEMEEYEQAAAAGRTLIEKFPETDKDILRGAWLVVAHSSYELKLYSDAEEGYVKVLELLPEEDKSRPALVDNLAISIYKQGEQAKADEDYRAAADHFLRVGTMAPTSKYRPNAEYDAAAALIQLKDWKMAASVLTGFREDFPDHELQPEVTKKIAYVYKEDGQLALAAGEYERMERESQDDEVRRGALMIAADLYEQVEDNIRALEVYRRYVGYFPQPVELNIESRNKIAEILKARDEQDSYLNELKQLVAIEAAAGEERTPRTRYLAGKAALVLAEKSYQLFAEIKLVKPFADNLRKKKELMKSTTQQFNKLIDYEVGEVTAAATFYLAEIYAHFSKSLMESERPEGLSPLEMEEYELAIEDQAYPFEERAIAVHESNLELISVGVYNEWIDKSLQKLAKFIPARYDKPEKESPIIASADVYMFAIGHQILPLPESEAVAVGGEQAQDEMPAEAKEPEPNEEAAEAEEPAQAQTETSLTAGDTTENKESAMSEEATQTKDENTAVAKPVQDQMPAEAKEPGPNEEAAEVEKSARTQTEASLTAGDTTENKESAMPEEAMQTEDENTAVAKPAQDEVPAEAREPEPNEEPAASEEPVQGEKTTGDETSDPKKNAIEDHSGDGTGE